MANTINSLEAFKKYTSVNTNFTQENPSNTSSEIQNKELLDKTALDFLAGQRRAAAREHLYYVKTIKSKSPDEILKTKLLKDDFRTKLQVKIEKAKKLPEYAYRGLKGDPDANFYEYLNLANIPYFIGGPVLAGVFLAGVNKYNKQTCKPAMARAKQIATGVVFYYLAVYLSKKVIDIPVKIFRGVDLNHPYENVVSCRTTTKEGDSPKKIEDHKVTESVDFTRWDLMYESDAMKKGTGKVANEKFDKLTKKFGIDKKLQDSDSTLKEKIKELIVSATALRYMMAAPFVALGVGLAAQVKRVNSSPPVPIWGELGRGIKSHLRSAFDTSKNFPLAWRLSFIKQIFKENLIAPFRDSFKAMWGTKTSPNKIGRAIMIATAVAPVLANLWILHLTSAKKFRFVDVQEYKKPNENRQKLKKTKFFRTEQNSQKQ